MNAFRRMAVLFPLLFMLLGFATLFAAQRQFYKATTRGTAALHDDLAKSGMSHDQLALLVEFERVSLNTTGSYIQSASFLVLMIPVFMAIPLYARLAVAPRAKEE